MSEVPTTLQPRLIKGNQADYLPAEYPGRNTSGIISYGKNVIVRVDECSPASSGGVQLPPEMVERMTMASTTGVLFHVAPEAFRLFDDGSRWTGLAPVVGDRIWFEKFAGQLQTGRDGKTYRIMDYRAVACGMDPAWEPADSATSAAA